MAILINETMVEKFKTDKKIMKQNKLKKWLLSLSVIGLASTAIAASGLAIKYIVDNKNLNNAISAGQNEIIALKGEIVQWQEIITQLESDLSVANEKISTLSDKVSGLQSQIDDLNKEIELLEGENKTLKTQVEYLQEKLGAGIIKDWVIAEQYTWEINQKNYQIQLKETEINNLNQKINELNDLIAAKDLEIASLNDQIGQLKTDLENARNEIVRLEEKLAHLQSEYDVLLVDTLNNLFVEKLRMLEQENKIDLTYQQMFEWMNDTVNEIFESAWADILKTDWVVEHEELPELIFNASSDVSYDIQELQLTAHYVIKKANYQVENTLTLNYIDPNQLLINAINELTPKTDDYYQAINDYMNYKFYDHYLHRYNPDQVQFTQAEVDRENFGQTFLTSIHSRFLSHIKYDSSKKGLPALAFSPKSFQVVKIDKEKKEVTFAGRYVLDGSKEKVSLYIDNVSLSYTISK